MIDIIEKIFNGNAVEAFLIIQAVNTYFLFRIERRLKITELKHELIMNEARENG